MSSKWTSARIALVYAVISVVTAAAHAQDTKPAASGPSIVKARELFTQGASLVKAAQWAEALGAFEQSSQLRPHPITTYNIGACERALGRYTVARHRFQRALEGEPGTSAALPPSLRAEATAYLAEIERVLVRVELKITPTDAAVAIDGRPLEAVDGAGGSKLMVAGLRPAGRGEALPAPRVEVVLDPGTHLLTLSRKGFSDQLVTKTFKPGTRQALSLNLDQLPAKLRVSTNEQRAVVRVDQIDVGYAPVDIERPAGQYGVSVEKPGFASYQSVVKLNPGEEANIKATLSPTPITQKWWFWTAASVLVTGAVVGTYFATRSEPEPQRPALDGGGLGWTVEVP